MHVESEKVHDEASHRGVWLGATRAVSKMFEGADEFTTSFALLKGVLK